MQLSTYSKFYYGWKITTLNRYLDFNDGVVKVATLNIGTYSSSEMAIEIKRAMDAVSTLVFAVSFNRLTRKFTISSTATFSLLTNSGTNAFYSAYELLGYSNTDKTGASSYLGQNASASIYTTQFLIQSFKDTTTNRRAIDGVINKSASGVVEVIKFGNERFMEGEFLFITDLIQQQGSIVRSNPTGLEDFISFMEYATERAQVEFMKDENDPNTFQVFTLEATETDSKGLDYDLIELYDRGLANYFRSGKLTFRLME